jgi:hypothetical protein
MPNPLQGQPMEEVEQVQQEMQHRRKEALSHSGQEADEQWIGVPTFEANSGMQ